MKTIKKNDIEKIQVICKRLNQLKEDTGSCANQLISSYIQELISLISKIKNNEENYLKISIILGDTFNINDIEKIFKKANWN